MITLEELRGLADQFADSDVPGAAKGQRCWRAKGVILAAGVLLSGCGTAGTDKAHVTPGATAVAYQGQLCGSQTDSLLDIANSTDHEVTGKCWVRTITAPDGTVTQESGIELSASSQATASQQAASQGFVDVIGALGPALGAAAGQAARTAAGVPR